MHGLGLHNICCRSPGGASAIAERPSKSTQKPTQPSARSLRRQLIEPSVHGEKQDGVEEVSEAGGRLRH